MTAAVYSTHRAENMSSTFVIHSVSIIVGEGDKGENLNY